MNTARHSSQTGRWTVTEICNGYAPATVAGKLLADLGHTVYKVEPRGGDPLRLDASAPVSLHDLLNASKNSVCADIEGREGVAACSAMLRGSDVLLVDLPAWETLCRIFGGKDEIMSACGATTICVASWFGMSGPLSRWKGSEALLQSLSGIMSMTGHEATGAVQIPGGMLTQSAAMFAVSAILADMLLRRRSTDTEGSLLDCNALLSSTAFLSTALPAHLLSDSPPKGIGNRHAMSAPWNTFPCKDGWLVICAGNEPSWRRLCGAINRSDLLDDPRFANAETRVAHVAELEDELAKFTLAHTISEAASILDECGIPCGPILNLPEVLSLEQTRVRSLVVNRAGTRMAGGVFQRGRRSLAIAMGRHHLGQATRDLVDYFGLPERDYRAAMQGDILVEHSRGVA